MYHTICLLQVIHDCRALAGSLFAQFGVKLSNIFDTQVGVLSVLLPCSQVRFRAVCVPDFMYVLFLFLLCLKVADVMCFYSETGGFLPDKVSTLQGVVSLHLKVSSSRLSSLQIKSQLTKVHSVSSAMVL